ncbi:hypothetical protein [Thermoactinospora rubra]|uniref:hypothetical protein n=1 Tax=Thermoactinospora rubra TaxID=1088767 RepID=UPI000A116396|nr:hypothetical protein [Thermoactinospora rubra]
MEAETAGKTLQATQGQADPAAALRAGALVWIRLASDPVVQRILLIDAPSVIGWERWREMEQRYALGMLRAALEATRAFGPELVDVFAHALLASLNEVALLVARSDDPGTATRTAETVVDELLRRLLR